jgi:3-keto-disaccharide hydrolase
MKRKSAIAIGALILGIGALQWSYEAAGQANASAAGWITLFDGKSLMEFNTIGDANWQLMDGVVQANKGTGFLVTKNSYADFQIKVEFWVDDEANSGVFLRCDNPQQINAMNAYEVNIYDKRPDPTYGTGAIVDVAKPTTMLKAGGKWNTFEITAQKSHLVVTLNGTKTVDVENSAHARGPIGLQYGAGTVKFRSVQIKPL